ncbi:MAG TPA: hypothetical protein VMJ93_13420 [Verrucomicrobiae bacterium]|nr:hypothetical protein [Verrucomicrobiae bacterium]
MNRVALHVTSTVIGRTVLQLDLWRAAIRLSQVLDGFGFWHNNRAAPRFAI